MESNILHCDLNNFFASVECVKNADLKTVPMAVCGDPKLRHGVILAKNDLAKKYGIITGETVYTAMKKCPTLILVEGNYDDYLKYSKKVKDIYLKYTNKVEPLSIDECYLDVTESVKLFGDSLHIANLIKEEVKLKTGLTISVGISFNKSFAKIGSDMKKPDAITVIGYSNFKRILYPKPIEIIMYVGKSTKKILNKYGIKLVGDLAHFDIVKLRTILGKKADDIYNVVKGNDYDKVRVYVDKILPKSVSKGITFKEDTNNLNILEEYICDLAETVSSNLRYYNLKTKCVSINVKDTNFITFSRQKQVTATNSFADISKVVKELLKTNYNEKIYIRSITINTSHLIEDNLDLIKDIDLNCDDNINNLFEILESNNNINNNVNNNSNLNKTQSNIINENNKKIQKQNKLNNIIDDLNKKYGENVVTYASVSKIIDKSANK